MLIRARGAVRRTLGVVAAACVGAVALTAPAEAGSIDSGEHWVLGMINVRAAWSVSRGQGATVAVLDSGVEPDVSELAGSVVSGPDLTGTKTARDNPHWGRHGTWMASIIAGHPAAGGGGVTGVAPQAKILSVRVIPDRGDPGYHRYERESQLRVQRSLAAGIRYAVNHGASVISMSIGYSAPSMVVRSALRYADRHQVVVVASAGNSGASEFARSHGHAQDSFPADYPGVIGVAAVGSGDAAAPFSSDNLSVQVAAPGVNVPAQGNMGRYWLVSGTSPACALVAGVAALIKSRYPRLSPALVARALDSTTRQRPSRGYDDEVGFGTVDAAAALSAAGHLADIRPRKVGVTTAAKFGGGTATSSPAPVGSRGAGKLVLFAVLALASLVLLVAAAGRLLAFRVGRRSVHKGFPIGGTTVAANGQGCGPDLARSTDHDPVSGYRTDRSPVSGSGGE